MSIKFEGSSAIVDQIYDKSKTDSIVVLIIFAVLISYIVKLVNFDPVIIGGIIVLGLSGLIFTQLPKRFPQAAENSMRKINIKLDENKNIICKGNWGITKNKEYIIKRSDDPFLEWGGFWMAQTLVIKTRKYHKDSDTRKMYSLATSATVAIRYKKEEVQELARYLDIPLEGSLAS